MAGFKVNGHQPDPENPNYWDFKVLSAAMGWSAGSGDAELRPYSSAVHDQRTSGSCVTNAAAKALEIRERHHKAVDLGIPLDQVTHTDISRLHLYFLCREMMNPSQVNMDNGTHISLCCDILHRFGICPESEWPFDLKKLYIPPSWKAMRKAYSASKIGLSGYYRIKSTWGSPVEDCIKALRMGHPVVFGTTVDEKQWFNYKKDMVLKPVSNAEGRHATCLVGWDDSRGLFIGENSWGPNWGDKGCYLMSPETIDDHDSSDFWVIRGHWEDSPAPK